MVVGGPSSVVRALVAQASDLSSIPSDFPVFPHSFFSLCVVLKSNFGMYMNTCNFHSLLTDPCLLLAYVHLFPEREHLVSKCAKVLSEVASKQASSEITLFERCTVHVNG